MITPRTLVSRSLKLSPLIALLLCFGAAASAEVRTVTIEIDAPFTASDGLGLLIQDGATIEKKIEESKQLRPGVMAVSFKYDSKEATLGTVANAMVWSKEGQVAMGTARAVTSPSSATLLSALETCPANSGIVVPNVDKTAVLESLVSLRKRVSETLKAETTKIVSEVEIERLRRLESKFGLEREVPLSLDLPPAILAERLWRIAAAVELFNNTKTTGKPTQTATAENTTTVEQTSTASTDSANQTEGTTSVAP